MHARSMKQGEAHLVRVDGHVLNARHEWRSAKVTSPGSRSIDVGASAQLGRAAHKACSKSSRVELVEEQRRIRRVWRQDGTHALGAVDFRQAADFQALGDRKQVRRQLTGRRHVFARGDLASLAITRLERQAHCCQQQSRACGDERVRRMDRLPGSTQVAQSRRAFRMGAVG